MHLKLAAKGTITDCREALNARIAELKMPESQENKVVRMIAHYIVAEHLDALHDPWQAQCNALRAAHLELPPEPKTSFAIDCSITLGT
jgi:hypothetical protein